jgi:hypothetical protein
VGGQPPPAVRPAKARQLSTRKFYPGNQPTQCGTNLLVPLFFQFKPCAPEILDGYSSFDLLALSGRSDSQKHQSGAIQPNHVFIGQAANAPSDS